jgi:hypothetical protein
MPENFVRPTKVIINVQTKEEQIIELTDEEIAATLVLQEQSAAREAELLAIQEAEEAVRESGRAKLAALGLTEAEVAALVK